MWELGCEQHWTDAKGGQRQRTQVGPTDVLSQDLWSILSVTIPCHPPKGNTGLSRPLYRPSSPPAYTDTAGKATHRFQFKHREMCAVHTASPRGASPPLMLRLLAPRTESHPFSRVFQGTDTWSKNKCPKWVSFSIWFVCNHVKHVAFLTPNKTRGSEGRQSTVLGGHPQSRSWPVPSSARCPSHTALLPPRALLGGLPSWARGHITARHRPCGGILSVLPGQYTHFLFSDNSVTKAYILKCFDRKFLPFPTRVTEKTQT